MKKIKAEMVNLRNHDFEDFTYERYRRIIKLAKSKYNFSQYDSFEKESKFVLWRHDLDFSIRHSLELARIEADEKVRATYFLLLHGKFYNLLEKENTTMVKEIISLGHQIGLHFDSHYYGLQDKKQLDQKIIFEKEVLESLFETPVKVFSFHNTTDFTMSCDEWEYGGLINVYATYFQESVKYCSDSNGYWRFERLEDVLKQDYPNLQILTHPGWYHQSVKSPFERVKAILQENKDVCLRDYLDILKRSNRLNVS